MVEVAATTQMIGVVAVVDVPAEGGGDGGNGSS